jgi:hypothetical protein
MSSHHHIRGCESNFMIVIKNRTENDSFQPLTIVTLRLTARFGQAGITGSGQMSYYPRRELLHHRSRASQNLNDGRDTEPGCTDRVTVTQHEARRRAGARPGPACAHSGHVRRHRPSREDPVTDPNVVTARSR